MRTRRRGVAIVVVMIVALVLGALAAILWTSDEAPQIEQTFEKFQAEFLAKGAQQHALLKCRLLPTELYDAVSYSIGRNPYYDFGVGLKEPLDNSTIASALISDVDASRMPGPMFYTGEGEVTLQPAADGTNAIIVRRTQGIEGDFADRMYLLLDMFTWDISTLFPDPSKPEECVVVVDSKPHRDLAMGGDAGTWQDPFIGNYKVQTLRILGLQGGRRYDRDTMLLTTVGSVKRNAQLSIVTQVGSGPKDLSPVRRTSHQASPEAFGEFTSAFEDATKYQQRMGTEDAETTNQVFDPNQTASGRRTEIATGVYYITRKAVQAE